MKKTLVLLGAFTLLSWSQVFAQVPTFMQFQGFLTDADGEPLRGSHEISFTLYGSADGSDSVWTEIHDVMLEAGAFTAVLGGSENPLDAGVFTDDQPLWLGVTVDDGDELKPRSLISAVPFATRAAVANIADNATGDITPKSVSVDDSTVIDESGQWVGDPTGLQGEQGIKGDTGEQGIQGEQGIKGDTGEQGIKGDTGSDGVNGADGIHCWDLDENGICSCMDDGNGLCDVHPSDEDINDDGVCDALDCTGSKGEQGIKGNTGDQGIQGEQGIKGNTGDQGIQGGQGIKGDTGDQGIQGEQGIKGDIGDTGLTGATGPQGEKGDTGNKGFSGSDGLDCWDLDGNSFCSCTIIGELCEVHPSDEDINDDGVCDALDCTGSKGEQGIKGDTGDQGIQGEQGIQGDTGDQGIQGDQGVKGDTGDQGLQGEQGIKGDTGDQGIQGDQGIKGDTGDTGSDGANGSDGIHCWDVDEDGICTLDLEDKNDDSQCTSADCIGLQGELGLTGDTGDTGSQGEQGIKGDTGDQGSAGTDGADGSDGIHCWDLNEDASCDLVTEDTNSSGDCDVDDCYSSAYTDLSNDGRLDYDDDDDLVTKSQADTNYAPATELDAALVRINTLETLLDGINAGSDACALGWDNCDANATCTDTDTGFTCECNENYTGDGVTCESDLVWTDPDTSYMWQIENAVIIEEEYVAEMIQQDVAISYCDDLTLVGFNDWRLPTISELRSLIRGCAVTETGGSCNVQDDDCLAWSCRDSSCNGCSNGGGPDSGCYWPSDLEGTCGKYWSLSSLEDAGQLAWDVSFSNGSINYGQIAAAAKYVRCVR